MKRLTLLYLICLAAFSSCKDDSPEGETAEYRVARAVTIPASQFRAEVSLEAPEPVGDPGKIYAYGDLILVGEAGRGIHLVDNSDPSAPVKSGFIPLAGNQDMAVSEGILYADSLTDLVVIDISKPGEATQLARLENVLMDPVPVPWGEADIFEYPEEQGQIVVGWEVVTERRPIDQARTDVLLAENMAAAAGDTGQGGSLARFNIVGDYLYAVDSHTINVFDISQLTDPVALEDVFAGFDIETLFHQGDMLFLGSRSGMYIYNIEEPSAPVYVSEFQHGTACDPVVVDGDIALVTLRGGNDCGAAESGLYIIDIRDITQPSQLTWYPMDGPYGLGFKGSLLFICDGASGLKVYDRSDLESLVLLQTLDYPDAYDVIPLSTHLLLIAGDRLVQFNYGQDGLSAISDFSLLE